MHRFQGPSIFTGLGISGESRAGQGRFRPLGTAFTTALMYLGTLLYLSKTQVSRQIHQSLLPTDLVLAKPHKDGMSTIRRPSIPSLTSFQSAQNSKGIQTLLEVLPPNMHFRFDYGFSLDS